MALTAAEHAGIHRASKDARNESQRVRRVLTKLERSDMARVRAEHELAALRQEVQQLRAFKAQAAWLLRQPHSSIAAEDLRGLRNALGLD